ncbi:MAG: DUF6883 domain-containing protein [Pseudomonadota bacterium]
MKLPNGERAIVEIDKLRRYCLDPAHPRGRHKARVFLSALGLSAADADVLRAALVRAAANAEAAPGQSDRYGTRYTFTCEVRHGTRTALVRCHWIVRRNEELPRLVTCYVA